MELYIRSSLWQYGGREGLLRAAVTVGPVGSTRSGRPNHDFSNAHPKYILPW